MARVEMGVRMSGRKRHLMCLVAAATVFCLWAQYAWSADWPHFRGPNRDGKSADTGLLRKWPEGGPTLAWAKEDLGHGYTSVVAVGDMLYTTGMVSKIGYVYALDLNGGEKWKAPYGPSWSGDRGGTRTTPTVYEGMVYVMSAHGRVVCFDAQTGEEQWAVDTVAQFGARNPKWGIAESLFVKGDKLICTPGGRQAGVVALNRNSGETIWVCKEIGEVSAYCSPFLIKRGPQEIVVTMTSKSLVGIDWKTGKLLWKVGHSAKYDIHAVSPVYEDGYLYVTSGYGGTRGAMFELSRSGKEITGKWTDSRLDCHPGGVIVYGGHIYGSGDRNNGGKWVCMNIKTGEVIAEIAGVGKGSITFADGKIYGYGEKGMVGLINASPEDFRLISSFKITKGSQQHWAHPVVANGRLYIRHGNALMAYDVAGAVASAKDP